MYIMINDIKGVKTIDLSYPICSSKEITVISMLSENTQYEITKPLKLKLVDGSEKEVLNKTYTSRELNAFVEGKHIISDLGNDPRIIKMNKLAKVTNMIFKLDERENTQYEMTKPLKLKLVDGSEKEVLNKTYTSRELNAFVEGKHIISDLGNDPWIIKTNKLAKVTNMIFKLDELDNTNNLEDGEPSNTLFTYYMPGSEDFMRFEPKTPRYEKLKNGEIVSLTLRITYQNNNIITNGPGTTVVFHTQ